MKIPVALLLVFLAIANSNVIAEQQPPQISVSGSAEIKVAPDEVELNVGIETRDEKLEKAKQENDDRVAAVLKFLKARGVAEKDIQTDFIGINPVYPRELSSWSSKGSWEKNNTVEGYVVQRSIGIRLRQVAKFDQILSGILASGVNTVNGITFQTSELRKHRDAARDLAVKAAKEKADALASGLGARRGKVYQISENTWGGFWNWSGSFRGGGARGQQVQNVTQNAGGGGESDGTMSVGQISVSATVNATFLIE